MAGLIGASYRLSPVIPWRGEERYQFSLYLEMAIAGFMKINSNRGPGFHFGQHARIDLAVRSLSVVMQIARVYHAITSGPESASQIFATPDVLEILANDDCVNTGRDGKLVNTKPAKRTSGMPIQRYVKRQSVSVLD